MSKEQERGNYLELAVIWMFLSLLFGRKDTLGLFAAFFCVGNLVLGAVDWYRKRLTKQLAERRGDDERS